ncbi:LytR/AlgR family response regulator transcription factor [Chitinophaga nivalis]|uniref:LytTR family DNA-binding domain-containing protein n=1 Tax=Chitinophaga nivalis TaxID=2991709 RepID=A0ABT3IGW4_9BACT|nr:LytTR family DNA-binding domain-containing protein [Chitinophaga nivalis]MCW3467122.1 LytTR family DNA-binding domain-containing protein [Chitinophaga nivalis]MCW3483187.1 LytTR family DNA-binding domain-containing protein [Chitinophaga nivalis]
MFTCLIISNSEAVIRLLCAYTKQTAGLTLYHMVTCLQDATAVMENRPVAPDIILLDIDEALTTAVAAFATIHTNIVFISAHREYAVDAFDENALDYLLLPFTYERFLKAIHKVKERAIVKSLLTGRGMTDKYFFSQSEVKGNMIKIVYDDIVYIEARANYLKVQLWEESHLIYFTMKEMESQLYPRAFIRVHKSFIVNIEKIKVVKGNLVLLENGMTVAIGASYRQPLMERISAQLVSSKRLG